LPEKQTTPRGPKKDPPGKLSRDFMIHKLEKMFAGGEGNKKYSEVKLETFINSALFHFTKCLGLRNTIR
jgi:hypothetical protein